MNYYLMAYTMHKHGKFGIAEIENMMPWEKNLFLDMLVQDLENEKTRLEEMQNGR